MQTENLISTLINYVQKILCPKRKKVHLNRLVMPTQNKIHTERRVVETNEASDKRFQTIKVISKLRQK